MERSVTKRRILIVDDDEMLRDSLTEQLALHPEFEIAPAGTAAEGLEQARATPTDLVVMDVGLPDFDGREAVKAIAKRRLSCADHHVDGTRFGG